MVYLFVIASPHYKAEELHAIEVCWCMMAMGMFELTRGGSLSLQIKYLHTTVSLMLQWNVKL